MCTKNCAPQINTVVKGSLVPEEKSYASRDAGIDHRKWLESPSLRATVNKDGESQGSLSPGLTNVGLQHTQGLCSAHLWAGVIGQGLRHLFCML